MNKFVKTSLITVFCVWLGFALFEQYRMVYHNESLHQFFHPEMYDGPFSEQKFPCSPNRKAQYVDLVNSGYASMKNSRVVICGLARNCATSLEHIERRIEETGGLFKDYRVVLFENDSDDETRSVLSAWQKRNVKVRLIDCKIPSCKLNFLSAYAEGTLNRNRFERMADFRNRYLAYVYKHYKKFDYMITIDMDLKGPWSLDGLASSFAYPDWDGMFAYGIHTIPWSCGLLYAMYDLTAYAKVGDGIISKADISKNYLKVNFWDYVLVKKGDPLLPVSSAFGGMGIYKIKSLKGCWYSGQTCEHVCLHHAMAEKGYGRFYINPNLILLSGHQGPPNTLDLVVEAFKEVFFQKKTDSNMNALGSRSHEQMTKKRLMGLALISE